MAKKFSDVFGSIKYAKMDPKHNKTHVGGSTDDEEHGAVSDLEFDQQVKHAKKRSMTESESVKRTQTNLKNIETSKTGYSVDDEQYRKHIERMKKSRDEYIKNNPNSIYAIKKEEAESIEEKSDQAQQNKTKKNTMDASRGARWKIRNSMTGDSVRNWDNKHPNAQAQNKAIGRALRDEDVELDEAKATYTIKDSEGNIKHAGRDKDIAYKTHKSLNAKETGHKLYKNGVATLAEDTLDEASRVESGALFKSLVDKADASSKAGNHTQAKRHLANAQTARYGIHSKYYDKHHANFGKYKELKQSYTNSDEPVRESVEPTLEQIEEAIDHIITARQIIGQSKRNAGSSHEYMKFLKSLRDKFGKEYSTNVHQSATKLAKESIDEAVATGQWHVHDTKTDKVHSTYSTHKKAINAMNKLNDQHDGYDTPGGLIQNKFGARAVSNVNKPNSSSIGYRMKKESIDLDEGWGAEPAKREAEAHAKAYDAVKEKHKRDPEASAILKHLKGMKAEYAEKEATGKGKQSREYWLKDIEKKKARMDNFKNVGVSLNKESMDKKSILEAIGANASNKTHEGSFQEKDHSKHFTYKKTNDPYAKKHNLPHEIDVHDGVRYGHVKGTVAHIATDENDDGTPKMQKWQIKNHKKWMKESRQADIVREAFTKAKNKKKDEKNDKNVSGKVEKYEADPELTDTLQKQ